MANHVDLDELILSVHSTKTKELLSEVYSCYKSGAYRSALVSLWTTLVSDLFFKLEELVDLYDDKKALALIEKIEKDKKDKPRSSDWEFNLVKDVMKDYEFISEVLYVQIGHLKDLRNACAHPTYKRGSELFHPNPEQCKGMIRTFVEELFALSPVFHSEISQKLLSDIAENKNIFAKDEDLKRYLNDKYYLKSTDYVLKKLFRTLWKLVFRIENQECDDNRIINFRALRLLVELREYMLLAEVKGEQAYYNNVSHSPGLVMFFAGYLCNHPTFLEHVNEANHLLVGNSAKSERDLILKSEVFFENKSDWEAAVATFILTPGNKSFDMIPMVMDLGLERIDELVVQPLIDSYVASSNFDSADIRYERLKYLFEYLSKEQFTGLIEGVASNGQTSSRGAAYWDHLRMVRVVQARFTPAEVEEIIENLPDKSKLTSASEDDF